MSRYSPINWRRSRDPEISTADALALLSVRDDDPAGIDRRRFLQMVGMGLGGGVALGGVGGAVLDLIPGQLRESWAAAPLGPNDGILVIIGMYGGNDGLNTVVPYTNANYYGYRSNIAIAPGDVLPLNGQLGLHPELTFLKTLWDQQTLAVVQGLGYPGADLSHFNSMATWMHGRGGGGMPSSGWIGRWLDGLGSDPGLYRAASVGYSLPLHMIGQVRRGTAIPEGGFDFGGGTESNDIRLYNAVRAYASGSSGRGAWHDAIAKAVKGQIDVAQTVAPVFGVALPDDRLARKLTVAARLINANLGLRVLDVGHQSDFDHHSDQPTSHASRMAELDAGVQAFFTNLDASQRHRVTLMTFSEFGRTPWSNASRGTDHGTSSAHFVMGANVKGGIYGAAPSLLKSNGQPFEQWDRIGHTTDFRSLYATMIDGLLGGGASTVLNGSYGKIDLFRPAGNVGGVTGGVVTTPPTEFVGIVPRRLLDTRDSGVPIGPVSTIPLAVGGTPTVPANALAAVLNVTAVGATVSSFLTVWPSGVERPTTSTLNMAGGDVVPNLTVTKLGADGAVQIYNHNGHTHCVVDVVGYFQTNAASRFTSLAPVRVLDTREGNGAPAGAVGQGASIDLQIADNGGVPDGAAAVVMNVTVAEPTVAGFVTVWPTGETMPTASNLNFVPGQVVPNLVIAKLGGEGKVSLYNSAGSTHLVADVLGYFREGDGAAFQPLSPARVLDTREGANQRVGQTPLVLDVTGAHGVPATGVSAVVINVTATDSTSNGYVTVFPDGEDIPFASNLNVAVGQTRANLVVAKVGENGAVGLFNSAGGVHLVADVVGYFT